MYIHVCMYVYIYIYIYTCVYTPTGSRLVIQLLRKDAFISGAFRNSRSRPVCNPTERLSGPGPKFQGASLHAAGISETISTRKSARIWTCECAKHSTLALSCLVPCPTRR